MGNSPLLKNRYSGWVISRWFHLRGGLSRILSIFRNQVDALFGFDFFISYGRRDATGYATRLHERLAEEKLHCFLDAENFVPGEELQPATHRNLTKSSAFVLIATPAAAQSPHVRAELTKFAALERPMVIVNIDRALQKHFPEDLRGQLQTKLWIDEEAILAPSGHAVRELCRQVRFTRQIVRRMRLFATVAILLFVLASATTYAAILAHQRARIALSRQLAAQARDRVTTQSDLALLLAAEAYEISPTIEAANSLGHVLGSLAQLVAHEHTFEQAVERLGYSADGRYFVASSPGNATRIWDLRNGTNMGVLSKRDAGFLSFAIHPDSTRLVACDHNECISIWHFKNPQKAVTRIVVSNVVRVAYAPDGHRVLAGTGDGRICLVVPETGDIRQLSWSHEGFVTAIVPDRARDRFFTSAMSQTNNVVMWDVKTLSPVRCFTEHKMSVNALALTRDGSRLASACEDRQIVVWDVESGRAEQRLAAVGSPVRTYGTARQRSTGALDLTYDCDNATLLAAYEDGRVIAWNLVTGEGGELRAHAGPVYSIAIQPGTPRLASAGNDFKVRFWDLSQIHPFSCRLAQEAGSRFMGFSADGRRLLVAGDAQVRSWDISSRRELATDLWVADDKESVVAFSAESARVALSSASGTHCSVTIRSGDGFKSTLRAEEAQAEVRKSAFDPKGRWFVSAARTNLLAVWDLRQAHPTSIPCHDVPSDLAVVSFSREGEWVIGGARSGLVCLWNPANGQRVSRVEAPEGYEGCSATTGHTREQIVVVAYSWPDALAFWSLADPGHPRLLKITHEHAPRSDVKAMAFDRSGKELFSLGSEGDAVFWRLPAAIPIIKIPRFGDGYLHGVPLSQDGRLVASWDHDEVFLFDLLRSHWVSRAREIAGRRLSDDEKRIFLKPGR